MENYADLDIDQVEALLQQPQQNQQQQQYQQQHQQSYDGGYQQQQGMNDHYQQQQMQQQDQYQQRDIERRSEERKKKKKKKHSRSRSRSHRRSKKHRRRSYSRSQDRYDRERRSYDDERSFERNKERQQQIDIANMTEEEKRALAHKQQLEATQVELKNLEEKFLQAQKEAEEAKREDLTVMMYCLPTKAKEKEIYKFLRMHKIGKIIDIRLIKDQRSRKSKGVAYVEFELNDSINKALCLNNRPFIQEGKEIPYSEIKVQHSQAEKNRAAAAARQIKQARAEALKQQMDVLNQGPTKIYIGGLTDSLASISDNELRSLFLPFGDIESVEVSRDEQSGKCKGYAYIVFAKGKDAEAAISQMNNYIINGQQIKVTSLSDTIIPGMPLLHLNPNQFNTMPGMAAQQNAEIAPGELDDENGCNFLHTAQARVALMKKLNRENPDEDPNAPGSSQAQNNPLLMAQNPLLQGVLQGGQGQQGQQPQQQSEHPPPHPIKTNFIFIGNMFTGEEVKEEPTFYADLQEDVEDECRNYGEILNVHVQTNTKGNIFVHFADMTCAEKCQQVMSQRFYNGKKLVSFFVTQDVYEYNLQK